MVDKCCDNCRFNAIPKCGTYAELTSLQRPHLSCKDHEFKEEEKEAVNTCTTCALCGGMGCDNCKDCGVGLCRDCNSNYSEWIPIIGPKEEKRGIMKLRIPYWGDFELQSSVVKCCRLRLMMVETINKQNEIIDKLEKHLDGD